MRLIALNKPCGVLSQFTDADGRATLERYVPVADVYPAGRLDRDSEGLLLLTDDGRLQHHISSPQRKLEKTYLVQVDGDIDSRAIDTLRHGVTLKDGFARASSVEKATKPDSLWPRDPPVRKRLAIPTSWLELSIAEGRNRQVRRMTAAVGFPTLRLIRTRIGAIALFELALAPGEWCELDPQEVGFAHQRGPRGPRRQRP